jgi:hypothetical protein
MCRSLQPLRSYGGRRRDWWPVELLRKHESGGQYERDGDYLEAALEISRSLRDRSDDRHGKERTNAAKGVDECKRTRG